MGHYIYIPTAGTSEMQVHRLDSATGKLALEHTVGLRAAGSALCTDPQRRFLYVTTRAAEDIAVSTYRIAPDGGLSRIGEVDFEGCQPCYLSTDRRGGYLLAAYYSDGLVTAHPIGADGAAHGPPTARVETERCAHWIATDPSNRYAFVPHVAQANAIYQFLFDQDSGTLRPNAVPKIAAGPGQGPRHLAFHPALDVVYADNEQECSVTVYDLDRASGTLRPRQTLSTLPAAGFEGEKSNAQLHLHPDGRAVYASNRGPDSIAVFGVDPQGGGIVSLGQQPAQPVPRAFGIDAGGDFLVSGADGSSVLTVFGIDAGGALEPVAEYDIGAPCAWVLPVKTG